MVRTKLSQNIMLILSFLVGIILNNAAGAFVKGNFFVGILSVSAVAITVYLMKKANIEE